MNTSSTTDAEALELRAVLSEYTRILLRLDTLAETSSTLSAPTIIGADVRTSPGGFFAVAAIPWTSISRKKCGLQPFENTRCLLRLTVEEGEQLGQAYRRLYYGAQKELVDRTVAHDDALVGEHLGLVQKAEWWCEKYMRERNILRQDLEYESKNELRSYDPRPPRKGTPKAHVKVGHCWLKVMSPKGLKGLYVEHCGEEAILIRHESGTCLAIPAFIPP